MSIQANEIDPIPRIIVGVDGSNTSLAALTWAATQAVLTAAPTSWRAAQRGVDFGHELLLHAGFVGEMHVSNDREQRAQ